MALEQRSNRLPARRAVAVAIVSAIFVIVAILYSFSLSRRFGQTGSAARTGSAEFWRSLEPTVDAADLSPGEPPDFNAIEAKCVELAPQVQSSVVGVLSPSAAALPRSSRHLAGASGIVISADGLVLSQFHVTHVTHPVHGSFYDFTKYHKPGEEALVVFADGTERRAKLLGASIDDDLSLVQLSEPGPYPFVELNADATVDAGDWVVKLGHPGGFRKDRLAPLRLGRVLLSEHDYFVTDCRISGGDSGGPFFDLNGRLIGIVNSDCDPDLIIRLYGEKAWDASAWPDDYTVAGAPRIAVLMEQMKRGEFIDQRSRVIEERSRLSTALRGALRLRPDQWTQSQNIKKTFEPVTAPLRASVVTVLNGSVPVALGTVVDEDGLAVTKASVLPSRPRCRLPDGRIVDLNVIGIDMAFDLAVMRIPPESIRPVDWLEGDSPPVGRIVLPVGPGGRPLSVGVVSVAVRQLDDPQQPKYDLPLRMKAEMPAIHDTLRKNKGEYTVTGVNGLARDAGIMPGDRLISIAAHRVAAEEDVARSVDGKQSGDIVPVVVVRDGKTLTLELPLLPAVEIGAWNRTWRCDDFPIALEYSPPAGTAECGGPIVDLSGRVVGVTVGQTNSANGWAIPADSVRRIVNNAKGGKIAPWTKD